MIEVRDETGRNEDIAQRIRHMLAEAAPLVEKLNPLPLPSRVRFRLVWPHRFREACYQDSVSASRRDRGELELTADQIRDMEAVLAGLRDEYKLLWLVQGMVTRFVDASRTETETLIAPRALEHSGIRHDDPYLFKLTVHELVHHQQLPTLKDARWPTFFPEIGPLKGRAFDYVLEGQASCVDAQATTIVYGAPVVSTARDLSTPFFKQHWARHDVQELTARLRPSYDVGAAFVDYVAAHHGMGAVNRVWEAPHLLPSLKEVTLPFAWLDRTAPLPHPAPGPQQPANQRPTAEVIDETGSNPALASEIDTILSRVAPVVEAASGLSLPPRPLFSLLDPETWHAENAAHGADGIECDQSGREVTHAWPALALRTVVRPNGRPETIITPQALYDLLLNEAHLMAIVTRELTRHAQIMAGWRSEGRQPASPHSDDERCTAAALAEYHAEWVEDQVAHELLGPLQVSRPDAPQLDRPQGSPEAQRLRSQRLCLAELRRDGEPPRPGVRFIEHVASNGGAALINRVWKNASLYPTCKELHNPLHWIDRVTNDL